MKIHKYPGFFVAVEGLDGCGADLAAGFLHRELRKELPELVLAKEPSSGPTGDLIRGLLEKKRRPKSAEFWAHLFAADRAWLMGAKVYPALEAGKLVICDRSLWSSIAYQSLDLPIHWLLEVNANFFIPDLTYFVDTEPTECAVNIKKGEDELQIFLEEERLSRIRDGYYWIFNKYPYWFKPVEGDGGPKKVAEKILEDLKKQERYKRLVRVRRV